MNIYQLFISNIDIHISIFLATMILWLSLRRVDKKLSVSNESANRAVKGAESLKRSLSEQKGAVSKLGFQLTKINGEIQKIKN